MYGESDWGPMLKSPVVRFTARFVLQVLSNRHLMAQSSRSIRSIHEFILEVREYEIWICCVLGKPKPFWGPI